MHKAIKSANFIATGLALILSMSSPRQALAESKTQVQSPTQVTVLIGIDGLSYNAFRTARAKGLFKNFNNIGAHVSPFPSMTDLSWSTVMHTPDVFGQEGRIKSVEATYFDESTKTIQGDPRDYYRRLAHPKYYLNAFENYFNPYVEGLMYFPTQEVPKLEVKSVIDDLIAEKPKAVMTGYIGAVDSTAHTQVNRLFPVLETLDSELTRLIQAYKEKGIDADIILVSDHGNIGQFKEGQEETELNGVLIDPIIKRAGMKSVQQLKDENDVAVPLMALGTWAPVYLKNRKNILPLIQEFSKESWFDLATYINRNTDTETVVTVISANGRATVRYDKMKQQYFYTIVEGNPLLIPEEFINAPEKPKGIPASWAMNATLKTPYPDSIFRVIEAASQKHFDYPDLIITLKDGNYIKGPLSAFTKMYRTHGSLTAASTYGIVASTKRQIPGQIRSKEILDYLKIDAKSLFGKHARRQTETTAQALSVVQSSRSKGVETDIQDLSQKRIFQYITRFVSDSRPFFVVDEMMSFMKAFKIDPFTNPSSMALSPMNFDISKVNFNSMMNPEDVGAITDAVLQKGDINKVMEDPRVQKVKENVGQLFPTAQASLNKSGDANSAESIINLKTGDALPVKRAAMKLYQMPYLLEKSFVIQEKPYLPETRNLIFASYWNNEQEKVKKDLSVVTKASANLFTEVQKENDLEDRVYPDTLDKVYNHKLSEDVTIVYIPGIYNSLFDKEIFSLGLNAIRDDLGLRVITPPVYSTCSIDYNADIILKYIKEDSATRVARGHNQPKYIILGYSKGGDDALAAFTQDPEFVANNILGLVAIATPLHGSSIIDKSDLPFTLVSALSDDSGPEICKTEKTAAKSINPAAMQRFWRKNEKSLIGLTRYFSVTFVSTPEDSHLFMKATKLIAQFDEDNDGVVTVSSSKFPDSIGATDLGTINADHLAGILASRFNQKVFMKSIINTLAELSIENTTNNFNLNSKQILNNLSAIKDRTYYRLTENKGNIYLSTIPLSSKILSPSAYQKEMIKNTFELNKLVFPKINDPADNYETKVKLPTSQIKFDPYGVLDVSKLGDMMAGIKVSPVTSKDFPDGINIDYHHTNMVHFRMDHQFNYESRSPGGLDDNANFGFITSKFGDEDGWLALRSKNNSIRMTTLAYRFKPTEFSKVAVKLAVTKGVKGADPVKGHTGVDDSAFQVWFSIREKNMTGDRTLVDPKLDKIILFGYYWGDPAQGENRKPGDIFEDWYSNKNVVVATLPEAKMLLLNDQSMLGKPQEFKRNLAEDLKRAFPGRNVADMEIVAITLQDDSNDAKDSSEAFFKHLKFNH